MKTAREVPKASGARAEMLDLLDCLGAEIAADPSRADADHYAEAMQGVANCIARFVHKERTMISHYESRNGGKK